MSTLRDQVALITGASSGIGLAVARDLDQAGMKLVLTGRNRANLQKIAESCTDAAVVVGDITDPNLPQVLLDTALESFGRLDVCFNNTGVMETGTVESVDIERICTMVRINVEAAFRLAYVVLRHFKKQNSGYLINTSSIAGMKLRDTIGPYAGTKFAIEAFTEALRIELAKTGVRAAAIEPGLVETHLQDHFPVHPKDLMKIEKMVQPEDVARCIRFMLEQPAHVRIPRMLIMPSGQPM